MTIPINECQLGTVYRVTARNYAIAVYAGDGVFIGLRCKYKDPETGASIIVWNEPWEIWAIEFDRRFVEPLPEDTILVTVDYHV
jgi:hypothetical protein